MVGTISSRARREILKMMGLFRVVMKPLFCAGREIGYGFPSIVPNFSGCVRKRQAKNSPNRTQSYPEIENVPDFSQTRDDMRPSRSARPNFVFLFFHSSHRLPAFARSFDRSKTRPRGDDSRRRRRKSARGIFVSLNRRIITGDFTHTPRFDCATREASPPPRPGGREMAIQES